MPESAQTRALVAMAQSIYGELGKSLELEGSAAQRIQAFPPASSSRRWTARLIGRAMPIRSTSTPKSKASVPRFYLLTRMVMELGGKWEIAAIVCNRSKASKYIPVASMTFIPNR